MGAVIAGSYLSLFVVQGQGPIGVVASVLSGLVFIRASMLVKRGKATIGGFVLMAFGVTGLIWSLWLLKLVGAVALIGGVPGLMALMGGILVLRSRPSPHTLN